MAWLWDGQYQTLLDNQLTIINALNRVDNRLRQLSSQLMGVASQGVKAMADLDALTAQVKANTDAEQSAITLIRGLADQLHGAASDPAAVQALADQLKASADALGAAVTENTTA